MNKLHLLETVLGKGFKKNKDYYQFNCPFHQGKNGPKLGISLNNGNWKCWVCTDVKGSTITSLFFKLNVEKSKQVLAKQLWKETENQIVVPEPVLELKLPTDFKQLSKPNKDSIIYKKALKYTISRGITIKDIIKHKIGYSKNGYIYFPNYDNNTKLNFYYGRAFEPTKKLQHLLAKVDKNIIGDEWLINWDEDIVLCESKIDAVIIRRNAIPLYGKTPSNKLKQQIVESPLRNIFICLDGDAENDIFKLAEYFIQNGKTVYHVKLPTDQDPTSLGFKRVWEYIENSKPITANNTFQHNLFNKLK